MIEQDRIQEKIAALKAKTTEAGCTEAEALAAAEMASRIMAEHGLTDAEIGMTTARTRETHRRSTWRILVADSVATVTNTAAVLLPSSEEIEFLGRAPGPQVAAYLYEVLVEAVTREAARFKDSDYYRRRRKTRTRKAALSEFADAMSVRLRLRLFALFADSMDRDATAAVQRAMSLRYRDMAPAMSHGAWLRSSDASAAGWTAAGDVTLAHGVNGAADRPLAISGQPFSLL